MSNVEKSLQENNYPRITSDKMTKLNVQIDMYNISWNILIEIFNKSTVL